MTLYSATLLQSQILSVSRKLHYVVIHNHENCARAKSMELFWTGMGKDCAVVRVAFPTLLFWLNLCRKRTPLGPTKYGKFFVLTVELLPKLGTISTTSLGSIVTGTTGTSWRGWTYTVEVSNFCRSITLLEIALEMSTKNVWKIQDGEMSSLHFWWGTTLSTLHFIDSMILTNFERINRKAGLFN